jgi:hypothetical protein
VLRGLPGDNPMGFLAALGVQVALTEHDDHHRLHWSDEPIPHAVVSPRRDLVEIAEAVQAVAADWLEGPALDEAVDPTLKLKREDIRGYLRRGRDAGAIGVLASCLLAEGSLDNSRKAKPSDLYFTAGQQKFVPTARTLLGKVTDEEIVEDMSAPWRYHSKRASLMWDSVDDRRHAYSAADPTSSQNPKRTNPGAEALALVGLSRYPCFASPEGTLTQGCSGSWKRGDFVWPLWTVPATGTAVQSLLAQVVAPAGADARRADWYGAWGVSRVLQSQIWRSSQGGYGTFGPPRVVWQRD